MNEHKNQAIQALTKIVSVDKWNNGGEPTKINMASDFGVTRSTSSVNLNQIRTKKRIKWMNEWRLAGHPWSTIALLQLINEYIICQQVFAKWQHGSPKSTPKVDKICNVSKWRGNRSYLRSTSESNPIFFGPVTHFWFHQNHSRILWDTNVSHMQIYFSYTNEKMRCLIKVMARAI